MFCRFTNFRNDSIFIDVDKIVCFFYNENYKLTEIHMDNKEILRVQDTPDQIAEDLYNLYYKKKGK
jgi:hypothetical protein